jgi:hypothetical protein
MVAAFTLVRLGMGFSPELFSGAVTGEPGRMVGPGGLAVLLSAMLCSPCIFTASQEEVRQNCFSSSAEDSTADAGAFRKVWISRITGQQRRSGRENADRKPESCRR